MLKRCSQCRKITRDPQEFDSRWYCAYCVNTLRVQQSAASVSAVATARNASILNTPQVGWFSVRYGVYNQPISIPPVGCTVAEIRKQLGGLWGIPTDAQAFKGRDKVDDDYVIQDGDSIEFHRKIKPGTYRPPATGSWTTTPRPSSSAWSSGGLLRRTSDTHISAEQLKELPKEISVDYITAYKGAAIKVTDAEYLDKPLSNRIKRVKAVALCGLTSKTTYSLDEMATCNFSGEQQNDHDPADVPYHDCTCGFYSYKDPMERFKQYSKVPAFTLTVELYGKVFQYTRGYRSAGQRVMKAVADRRCQRCEHDFATQFGVIENMVVGICGACASASNVQCVLSRAELTALLGTEVYI